MTISRFILLELYRTPARAVLTLGIAMVLAAPLAAQTRLAQSALAGVELPLASNDWSADADGSKGATLDLAASLAGSECEAREAHAWKAADQAASENVRTRTEAAFATSGWVLEPVSHTSEGQRILLARRGTERLVMVWRPEETEIGLLLCRIEPGAAPQAVASGEPALSPSTEQRAPPTPSAAPPAPGDRVEDALEPPPVQSAATEEAPEIRMAPPATVEPAADEEEAAAGSAANLWLRLIAVGLLILGGIGLVVRDFRNRALSVEWRWPTAAATIERGWVEEQEHDDKSGNPVNSYMPMLRYRYRVDDEEFQGGGIGLDDRPLPSAEAALRLLSKYPDFATVEIRYDPEDPSFAAIETPRPPPGREFYFGLGAVILALAVLAAHLL